MQELSNDRPTLVSLPSAVRGAIKTFGLFLLSKTGAVNLSQYLTSRNLVVVSYHRVVPRDSCAGGQRPPNTLFVDEFEEQMAFLAKRFTVLNGDELRAIVEGSKSISPYSLAITFDDGYENNFRYAVPVLRRYGLHAVFFLTTSLIGNKGRLLWFDRLDRILSLVPSTEVLQCLRRIDSSVSLWQDKQLRRHFKSLPSACQSGVLDALEQHIGHSLVADRTVHALMNWDQVREMAAAGMTIGSHTASHQILSTASPAEVEAELVSSRKTIEQETGHACWCFAYPNGEREDFRRSDEAAVQEAGYLCAFTQIGGTIGSGTPRYALPRISIPDTGDMRVFQSYLSGIHHALEMLLRRR